MSKGRVKGKEQQVRTFDVVPPTRERMCRCEHPEGFHRRLIPHDCLGSVLNVNERTVTRCPCEDFKEA